MTLDPTQARIAGTGKVLVAPTGTAAPTGVTTAWGSGWVDLGYTNDEGVTLSQSREREGVPVWQSVSPIRYVISGVELSVAYTLMQWNQDSLGLYFPNATISQPDPTNSPDLYRLDIPASAQTDERSFGVEWTDGTITYRMVVARGEVTETDDMNMTRTTASGLPLTVSALTDANELLAYILTNDPAFASAAA